MLQKSNIIIATHRNSMTSYNNALVNVLGGFCIPHSEEAMIAGLPPEKTARTEVNLLSHVINLGMLRIPQHSFNEMLERNIFSKSLNLLSYFFLLSRLNIKKIIYVLIRHPLV